MNVRMRTGTKSRERHGGRINTSAMRMRDLFNTITEDESALIKPSAKPKGGNYQGQSKKTRYQDGSSGREQKPASAPKTTKPIAPISPVAPAEPAGSD